MEGILFYVRPILAQSIGVASGRSCLLEYQHSLMFWIIFHDNLLNSNNLLNRYTKNAEGNPHICAQDTNLSPDPK